MKIKLVVLLAMTLLFITAPAQAQSLRGFLKNCAWGTAAGAAAGVVSLAFTNKPSESFNNVAKGASLGLYAGIGYGLYQLNKKPEIYQAPEFSSQDSSSFMIAPQFADGKVAGVQVSGVVLDF